MKLEYPNDAEAHFEYIHHTLRPWLQNSTVPIPDGRVHTMLSANGFHGPWLENLWISEGMARYAQRRPGESMRDVFGPVVPIFLPWDDWWCAGQIRPHRANHIYPQGLVSALLAVLRPTVPYATVSMSDMGISGRPSDGLPMRRLPNVLVFSSGGYGHIPLPLLQREQPAMPSVPMAARSHFVSYVGSLAHAPHNLRPRMLAIANETAARLGESAFFYKGSKWDSVVNDSRISLSPRGFGRSAYRTFEVLQMGRLPIVIHSDLPWVPYAGLFERVAWTSNLSALPALLENLKRVPHAELERRERLALSMRQTHWTWRGVLDQIFGFLNGTGSDLRCQPLPRAVIEVDS